VSVLTDPAQYSDFIHDLQQNRGRLGLNARLKLAQEAFSYVSYYDTIIEKYFSQNLDKAEEFPQYLNLSYKKENPLRYGENPHQQAFIYRDSTYKGTSLLNCQILSGKELSYNNLVDLEAALDIIADFEEPFAVIIKHTNPTGAACGETLAKAYEDALASDPLSAYGGIVGLNHKVDFYTARKINATTFVECILAPEYDKRALELLKTKKNRRILAYGKLVNLNEEKEIKPIKGGALVQTPDKEPANETTLRDVPPSRVPKRRR
jgi:phosphoribosylaminoimidazolecarboxamide formyltransferase/IMP cyclohydrolase